MTPPAAPIDLFERDEIMPWLERTVADIIGVIPARLRDRTRRGTSIAAVGREMIAFTLFNCFDFTYREVADRMGIHTSSVKRWMRCPWFFERDDALQIWGVVQGAIARELLARLESYSEKNCDGTLSPSMKRLVETVCEGVAA